MKSKKLRVLEKLESLVKDGGNDASGICYELLDILNDPNLCSDFVFYHAKEWPKYSGSWIYPVPPCNSSFPSKDYAQAMISIGLWSTKTQYGRDRRELAQFIIDRVKAGHDKFIPFSS